MIHIDTFLLLYYNFLTHLIASIALIPSSCVSKFQCAEYIHNPFQIFLNLTGGLLNSNTMTKSKKKHSVSTVYTIIGSSLRDKAKKYRKPMIVMAVREYVDCVGLYVYPLCPRCSLPMEREYQQYCDHCGQALDWEQYSKAKVIKVRCSKCSTEETRNSTTKRQL